MEPAAVSDGADERAERDAMISRLAGLPKKQRAAVVLRYYREPCSARRAAGCSHPVLR
ncbi:hypothetical protein SAMN05216553_106211 [Lentzea fradiae]|uniref:Uncharacterized protein n=1 Tax=Lentzea fradiae TaxID=200378 RepID=A0A1G7SEJ2_9PSEU|nr:hypothetical protein SAMN05216553_106211 [Lentzea fradiae]